MPPFSKILPLQYRATATYNRSGLYSCVALVEGYTAFPSRLHAYSTNLTERVNSSRALFPLRAVISCSTCLVSGAFDAVEMFLNLEMHMMICIFGAITCVIVAGVYFFVKDLRYRNKLLQEKSKRL